MINDRTAAAVISIALPPTNRESEWRIFFENMGLFFQADVAIHFIPGQEGFFLQAGEYEMRLKMDDFEQVAHGLDGYRCYETVISGGNCRYLSANGSLAFEKGCAKIDGDFISPVFYSFSFYESRRDLRRDTFGLIEGKNSYRAKLGILQAPLFEETCLLIGYMLNLPARIAPYDGRPYAVGVSCDIDSLEPDHLRSVLELIIGQGVENPTLFLYARHPDWHTKHDPVYDLSERKTRDKLKPLLEYPVEVGLHGGYICYNNETYLRRQKQMVEDFIGRPVVGYRSHFLRFRYPSSLVYQKRCGFEYDASLGYPDMIGAQNAACEPVVWRFPEGGVDYYRLFGSPLMDQHFQWPELWPEQSQQAEIEKLLRETARVGGCLVTDYHTYTCSHPDFPNWWKSWFMLMDRARADGALLSGLSAICARQKMRGESGKP